MYKRWKLEYDEPLSNFAFNFNLRRYIEDTDRSAALIGRRADALQVTLEKGQVAGTKAIHSSTFQINLRRFWSLKH